MIYTLVPLGNPGEKYVNTRHNAGRVVLDLIRDDLDRVALDEESMSTVEIFIPETFMNESGKAVHEYLKFHEGREIVVIYDDKDLPIGTMRISFGRGDGGHNGLKSVIESLGEKDFIRIRVGIAPNNVDGKEIIAPHGDAVHGFVLGKLREDEEEALRKVSTNVLGAIKMIMSKGYQKAMEVYNGK